jgi:hypothetical protein
VHGVHGRVLLSSDSCVVAISVSVRAGQFLAARKASRVSASPVSVTLLIVLEVVNSLQN